MTTEPAQVTSIKDKLAKATMPERQVDICLHTDLREEWEAADLALREAVAQAHLDKRLNSSAKTRKLAEQVEALQEEMREHSITLTLRAMRRRAWDDLLAAHPPREDHTEDAAAMCNVDTFFDAAIRACTVDPNLDADDWRRLLGDTEDEAKRLAANGKDVEEGVLTAGQYAELQGAVMALNTRRVNVPNSLAASRILRPSEVE